jgi:hypothetical protein
MEHRDRTSPLTVDLLGEWLVGCQYSGEIISPLPSLNGPSHDFVLVKGRIRSDPDFRAQRDELFGAVDMQPLVAQWEQAN